MIPILSKNDMLMFYKYLDNATVYFEYGSGGSTYQASLRNKIKKIYSVESDILWLNKLKYNITHPNINYIYNEMDTQPDNYGHPGENATNIQKINYSNHILNLSNPEQKNIDLILIDGRFRVACCLKCYDVIDENCFIAFDDFLDRTKYHIVLDYFNVVEQTVDNRMVILTKKKNKSMDKNLIKKYELIQD
jgi:protein O-GlcNAc transferase